MSIQSTDLKSGQDFTALSSVTASQLNQAVDQATLQTDRGLIIETQDSALDTPVVPDAGTTTNWKRYNWRRVPHSSDTLSAPKQYQWNPNRTNDATLKRWEVFVPRRTFDPCDYGADPTGVVASNVGFRKAVYAANAAGGGSVKVRDGIYKLSNDINYGTGESKPFYYNINSAGAWAQATKLLIPLLDNVALVSEGRALIRAPIGIPGTDYGINLFGAVGTDKVLIEGLTIDGQCDLQPCLFPNYTVPANMIAAGFPGAGPYNVYCGAIFRSILGGNKTTIRNNHIFNFGGGLPIPANSAYTAIIDRQPQVDLALVEIYQITVHNECRVEDNIVEKCWGGGVMAVGCLNEIKRNTLRDLGSFGVNLYHPHEASLSAMITNQTAQPYYLSTKYQKLYRNRDLGSLNAIASGFFGGKTSWDTDLNQLMTNAELAALDTPGTNAVRSLSRYYALFNVVDNNHIVRGALRAIYLEQSLGTVITNNLIVQGIPDLPKCGIDCPLPLVNGKYLTQTGSAGIHTSAIAGESFIQDNRIISDGTLVKLNTAGTQKSKYIGIQIDSLYHVVDSDSSTLTQDQAVPIKEHVKDNTYIGNDSGVSTVEQTSLLAIHSPFNLVSCGYAGTGTTAILPVTEINVERPLGPEPYYAHPFLALTGKFNITNPQGAGAFESGYLTTTSRQPFRFLPLRRDVTWEILYTVTVRSLNNSAIYARQFGKIVFSWSAGGINRFEHDIKEINFQSGSFEIGRTYDQLLPTNIFPGEGRTMSAMYRGGLLFYFNAWDETLFSYKTYTATVDSNLVFDFSGEITEI